MPSRYFKSSFARSLSLNNNNSSSSGGGSGVCLTLSKQQAAQSTPMEAKQQTEREEQELLIDLNSSMSLRCLTPPPALPARRYTASSGYNNNNNNTTRHNRRQLLMIIKLCHWQPNSAPDGATASDWDASSSNQHHSNSSSNLSQQQQQPTLNVEAVILQNQVDTLHWQLKQTETNCEMYRAVMEEVARFFERYQQQQQLQQQQRQQQQQQSQVNRHSLSGEQISRSKSLHHVLSMPGDCQEDAIGNDSAAAANSSSSSYLRARSSTNLMLNKSMGDPSYESIAPAGSYNAFKDFTWRRSPKKFGAGGCKQRLCTPEAIEEKLNQEAFRLARTIRNLLHTSQQQPDLTQPRLSLSVSSAQQRKSTCLNSTLEANSSSSNIKCSNAEMLFMRANNMRDSRLSLRSSTDSSVHSTISSTASSSSKTETDEEQHNIAANNSSTSSSSSSGNKPAGNGSSTEDESGFSSISSFHDVGLPLSSTLRHSLCNDSRNSTLKSTLNAVGVPAATPPSTPAATAAAAPALSPAKTYRIANRYQRFSTLSNEDAAAVLWV
ncbi:protein P54 [Drosophila busckii]|uniref:protein P54 n=1 Tax=Drosophila busckii TaxID=30019 RepID=UPI0014329B69|nr:protein P54 [Drosophila busckii]